MVFLILSILAVVPAVGLGIDVSIMYLVKAKLTAACDGASLAAARNLNLGITMTQQAAAAQQRAQSYYQANYPLHYLGSTRQRRHHQCADRGAGKCPDGDDHRDGRCANLLHAPVGNRHGSRHGDGHRIAEEPEPDDGARPVVVPWRSVPTTRRSARDASHSDEARGHRTSSTSSAPWIRSA